VIAVKNALLTFILLGLGLTAIGLGQSALSPEMSRMRFKWKERGAHGIDNSQTIRSSRELSADAKEPLTEAVAMQMRPFKVDLQIRSEKELREIATTTRVKLIDLNNDGIAEVLAQALGTKAGCGATGNCPFWVFQKMPNGFKKILDTRNKEGFGGVEVITISSDRTESFNDLVVGTHDSSAERTLFVYRYHHGQYHKSECYKANWVSFNDDKRQVPEYPGLTQCRE
jgi:hypothetical protein